MLITDWNLKALLPSRVAVLFIASCRIEIRLLYRG